MTESPPGSRTTLANKLFSASSAVKSTCERSSLRTVEHDARSNIHRGTSRRRLDALPHRRQRAVGTPALTNTSSTNTSRPPQG